MMIQNDEENLYILLDVTGDTTNDKPLQSSPWGDYYWVSFDIDKDRNISPGVDTNYAPLFVPGLKVTLPFLYPLPNKDLLLPIVDVSKIIFNRPIPEPPPVIIMPFPGLPTKQIKNPVDIFAPSARLMDLISPVDRVTLPALNLNDTTRLAVQNYVGTCAWTGMQDCDSRGATGFGASLNSAVPHRQFEFAFKLSELKADPSTWTANQESRTVRMGTRINSQTPNFLDEVPASFCNDFTNLTTLLLATRPVGGTGLGLGRWFRGVGLIPRQKISQVTGLATTDPGYYLPAQDAPFGGTLQIFGNWAFLRSQGALKYRVIHRHNSGAGWSDWSAIMQAFGNYHLDPDGELRYRTITPASGGWVNVPALGDDDNWYLRDIISEWTTGADGMEELKVEITTWSPVLGYVVSSPGDPDNSLLMRIVNTPPSAHLTVRRGGVAVGPCDVITLGAAPDGFTLDTYVSDVSGNLMSYVTFVSGPLGESGAGCTPPVVAGGSDSYNFHAGTGSWSGPGLVTLPSSGVWRPSCGGCYQFHVYASSRTTNGYTHFLAVHPEPVPVKVIMP
jgi:hypothetical protein